MERGCERTRRKTVSLHGGIVARAVSCGLPGQFGEIETEQNQNGNHHEDGQAEEDAEVGTPRTELRNHGCSKEQAAAESSEVRHIIDADPGEAGAETYRKPDRQIDGRK